VRITKRTKTADVLPLLNDERLEYILSCVPPVPLRKPVLAMTVGEYVEALEPGWSLGLLKTRRALTAFGRLKQFRTEMEGVAKFFERYTVPLEPKDKASMAGIQFPTPQEALLLEAFELFRCHRIDGAGLVARWFGRMGAADVPLAEFLLAHKQKAASAQLEAARSRQMRAEMRMKGGRK
jgi:hypothetical protein